MAESENTEVTIDVPLVLKIDVTLLRRQKRYLVEVQQDPEAAAEAKTAIEGILNLLDFVQDQIVDQGLASEPEVFGFSGRSKVPNHTGREARSTRRA